MNRLYLSAPLILGVISDSSPGVSPVPPARDAGSAPLLTLKWIMGRRGRSFMPASTAACPYVAR